MFFLERIDGSNHQRCSVRKGVLRNIGKSTGVRLCQSLLFNKVAGLFVENVFNIESFGLAVMLRKHELVKSISRNQINLRNLFLFYYADFGQVF